MNAAPVYDLILQGGHVICPASGIDGVMDVAIAGGKIAQVGKDILPSTARQVTDVRGFIWIDAGMLDQNFAGRNIGFGILIGRQRSRQGRRSRWGMESLRKSLPLEWDAQREAYSRRTQDRA